MSKPVLYDYWRSSAAYRVRIALNLKGVAYESRVVSLIDGEQSRAENRARNPQGLVPTLEIDGHELTQSLAIIDYLDARYPDPALVSSDPAARSRTLARAMVIAADIHPLDNLRVLKYLKNELGHEQAAIDTWYRHWIAEGFAALEAQAPDRGLFGGDTPDLSDICLVPQMYNARRFETDLAPYPKLVRIDAALNGQDAFAQATPEAVKP
ncbi:maleylacetoacetate isomerase [Pseudoblastomonas halimionae]|uniref:Maleylacetoacetate isomerase n=1 Tax=Alteriqipengyuania halimionae TaxID=1926630 RepID=A0A6I4U2F1_9SPHN|nr:maleylacetoacetate isomerase [Alteriqipengyuania halimionae]MXP10190.1 maleylacetoacetate isomerase [Alteriqipengyuania halimionae]